MLKKNNFDNLTKKEKLIFLAGVFEGEGSFGLWGKQTKNNMYLTINVNMIDRDIIERFLNFFKTGSIYTPKLVVNRKQQYAWKVTGKKAMEIMLQMAPYFGIRRKEKFEQCCQSYKQLPHLRKSYLIQLTKQSLTKTLPLN